MLKRIYSVFTTLLVIAAVMLAAALAGVRIFGIRPMTVLSGSMEPEYPVGSLIYVKPVDYRDLQVGDVITFMLSEDTIATHRIVEIIPDEEEPGTVRYRTKGDANETEDGGLVHYKNVVGSPVYMIPKLGFFANYIQNPPGRYMAISGGAILILLLFLPELLGAFQESETVGEGLAPPAKSETVGEGLAPPASEELSSPEPKPKKEKPAKPKKQKYIPKH